MRRHRRCMLVASSARLKKLVAKPTFRYCRIINENLCFVEMMSTSVFLSKPIYIANAVLDLSKMHVYSFHYKHIMAQYGSRANRVLLIPIAYVIVSNVTIWRRIDSRRWNFMTRQTIQRTIDCIRRQKNASWVFLKTSLLEKRPSNFAV